MPRPRSPLLQTRFRPYLVTLSMPDLDASILWYTDNPGFRVINKKDFPDYKLRRATLERDSFDLELVRRLKAPAALLPGYDSPALLQGFGKLVLVRDMDIPGRSAWR